MNIHTIGWGETIGARKTPTLNAQDVINDLTSGVKRRDLQPNVVMI